MIKQHLDEIVFALSLSENPFYQAWNAGTLTKDQLSAYATEYAHFLSLMPIGWQTVGDSETAHEEEEHAQLWERFSQSLSAKAQDPQHPATKRLVALTKELFAKKSTALGALYAFEVQQPMTAQSKRRGLATHYAHLHADEAYFEVHEHNEHEAAKLLAHLEALSSEEQKEAVQACLSMSRALWDTLVSLHDRT